MSIESKIPQEEINIKALNVEQPEAGSFDLSPENYITAEDKELMLASLELYRHNRMWVNFQDLAADIKNLFPELEPELKLSPEVATKIINGEGAINGIKDGKKQENYFGYLFQSRKFLELFTDQSSQLDLNQETWEKSKVAFEKYVQDGSVYNFLAMAVNMKILFPNKQQEITLSKDQQNLVETEIKRLRNSGEWGKLANYLANYRLLFPGGASKFILDEQESNNIVQELKKKGHTMANNDQFRTEALNFSEHAMNMKIIAASEAKLTDKGIELTASQQIKQQKQQLPEIKKF